ncbi:hypothetical protein E2C01_061858 [Portunus trituberculatus]|uniref:Uncharacterized protein n=1 Tax=Portunus trituberculatus TaxID=210409 RepID=A0A5B7HD08_PORTR|nr:hypothetical protein [Portunus trituberculatus]
MSPRYIYHYYVSEYNIRVHVTAECMIIQALSPRSAKECLRIAAAGSIFSSGLEKYLSRGLSSSQH